MSRSHPKGKGKGSAQPRRGHFDDIEDDRPSPRGYRIDEAMDVDYGDRNERRHDRGGDARGARRDHSRDDGWEERRDTLRDENRGPAKNDHQDDWREGGSEGLITQYFPTTGIEWEVIAGDIQIYLGPEASVKIGPDPDDSRRMAYWVKAKNNILTSHMLSDLMADSVAWKNEKVRDRHSQSYINAQTHREREKRGPSRPLPLPPANLSRPHAYDQYRSEGVQSPSTLYSPANRSMMGTSPPAGGDAFAQSMRQARSAAPARPQDQSLLTRGEAEQIIGRRLRDSGQTGITRAQLEYLIDEALGQASLTQEQVLTREQAQMIIAQRLKAAGKTTVTKAQLEGLVNQKVQESKQENIERVVDEAIQKGQERPAANQGRSAAQAAPPSRPTPRPSNPDPDGTYGTKGRQDTDGQYGAQGHPDAGTTYGTKGPDMSRHMRPG